MRHHFPFVLVALLLFSGCFITQMPGEKGGGGSTGSSGTRSKSGRTTSATGGEYEETKPAMYSSSSSA